MHRFFVALENKLVRNGYTKDTRFPNNFLFLNKISGVVNPIRHDKLCGSLTEISRFNCITSAFDDLLPLAQVNTFFANIPSEHSGFTFRRRLAAKALVSFMMMFIVLFHSHIPCSFYHCSPGITVVMNIPEKQSIVLTLTSIKDYS